MKHIELNHFFSFFCITVYLLIAASTILNALPVIHVVGDSHAQEFSQIPGCEIHWLGPITMHRAGRDGISTLNLTSIGVEENQVAIFVFGEIDVRCHIGKIRDQGQRNLDEIIETLAAQYIRTILANRTLYKNLLCIVYSVTPPTICYNPDYPTYGSLEDRVSITKKLNARLANLCSQANIEFIDIYDEYSNFDGTLNAAYSDGNVHINSVHFQTIAQKLKQILIKNKII